MRGWRCRLGGGFTNRANSANPVESGARLDDVLPTALAVYPAHALPVLIRVTPLAAPDCDARLADIGLDLCDPSIVMTRAATPSPPDPGVDLARDPASAWLTGYAQAAVLTAAAASAQAALLGRLRHPAAFASVVEGGQAIGFGVAISAYGETGLFNIVTAHAARGRGIARRVTAALLGWGAARGDQRAYLQVLAGNDAALALYDRVGFAEAYRYHYRIMR